MALLSIISGPIKSGASSTPLRASSSASLVTLMVAAERGQIWPEVEPESVVETVGEGAPNQIHGGRQVAQMSGDRGPAYRLRESLPGPGSDMNILQIALCFSRLDGGALSDRSPRICRLDLFASDLEPASFDLVHARFQLSPLGRHEEQMASYLRLVRPGGVIVLEDVDAGSWHFLPPAPALEERLLPLLMQAFDAGGGDPHAALRMPRLFRDADIEPTMRAEVQALPPGHPYVRLPLQFATAFDGLLRKLVDEDELADLLDESETELADPGRWGLTFTLVQGWGRRPK